MAGDEQPIQDAESIVRFAECERRIGYIFDNKGLLASALTHASGAEHRLESNERLEFLGDAILGMLVCEMLYELYPKYLEGDLTKIKSVVVSRQVCASISTALELGDFLILGKGMANYPTVPHSVLADVFEALLAALYLDGGIQAARRFVRQQMGPEIERVADSTSGANFKSVLQQLAQRQFATTPTYQLLDEKGPDHSKCFQISAQIGSSRFHPAWGRNKKEAEQRAAQNAICQLRDEEPPYSSD